MPSYAVIGCGGIGSYLAEHIKEMIDKEQLPLTDDYVLVDFDFVEPKNLLYQNFTEKDLGKNKAEVLAERYGFKFKNEKIASEKQLEKYNRLIICADNTSVRELCYRHSIKNKKLFIDLRCQGRINAYLVFKKQKLNALLETLPEKTDSGSCQIEQRLENNQIDISNRIVALKGIQLLLNIHRGIEVEEYATENI